MKKSILTSVIILVLIVLFFAVPKPYSISTDITSCDSRNSAVENVNIPPSNTDKFIFEDLGVSSLVYVTEASGWCVGLVYPTNKEWEIDAINTSCTVVTKGWNCLGSTFSQNETIAL